MRWCLKAEAVCDLQYIIACAEQSVSPPDDISMNKSGGDIVCGFVNEVAEIA